MRSLVSTGPSTGLLLAFAFLLVGCSPAPEVSVHYLGHASFVLKFGDGPVVLTDYGESNAYGLDSPIHGLGEMVPDIVTLSHEHADHAGGELPEGIGTLLDTDQAFSQGSLTITPVPTHETTLLRPDNLGFLFEYRGLKILHMGDCQGLIVALRGGALSPDGGRYDLEGIRELAETIYPDHYDLVLLPIGSTDNILAEAAEFAGFLDAEIIVPMHYWSPDDKAAFLERMADRLDPGGQPYDSREVGGATLTLGPEAETMGPVKVLGLTPAPYPGM